MRIKRSSMKRNNDIPDKIMERIRKLMRLKESTTSEGEARAAAAAASRLLKEYNSFIQAYVFTMLSAVFIGLAREEHTEKAGEKKAVK